MTADQLRDRCRLPSNYRKTKQKNTLRKTWHLTAAVFLHNGFTKIKLYTRLVDDKKASYTGSINQSMILIILQLTCWIGYSKHHEISLHSTKYTIL